MSKCIFTRALIPLCAASFLAQAATNTAPMITPAKMPATAPATTQAPTTTAPAAPTQSATTPTIDAAPVATPTASPSIAPLPPQLSATGFILMDANTGAILAHKNMHQRMEPASLTKLMTLYLTSVALKNQQIKLTDMVTISKDAWQTGGSRMFIKVGSQVSVQDLINGIIIASGNDACVALSEFVGGNEQTFVTMMNQAATQLGMNSTHFMDSTGLPDPQHFTTPYDMALLTRAIITQFPEDYAWYKQKWITYNGIKQPNRNRLLWRDPSVDGLKTGHTEEAGYCLIASGVRNGMRLIAVIMGTPTDAKRADDTEALLNWGFHFYSSHKLFDANQALAHPRVWLGANKTIPVGVASALYVTIPKNTNAQLTPKITLSKDGLRAPIQKGAVVGSITIQMQNNVVASAPLVALQDDPKGNIFSRAWDHIAMFF